MHSLASHYKPSCLSSLTCITVTHFLSLFHSSHPFLTIFSLSTLSYPFHHSSFLTLSHSPMFKRMHGWNTEDVKEFQRVPEYKEKIVSRELGVRENWLHYFLYFQCYKFCCLRYFGIISWKQTRSDGDFLVIMGVRTGNSVPHDFAPVGGSVIIP